MVIATGVRRFRIPGQSASNYFHFIFSLTSTRHNGGIIAQRISRRSAGFLIREDHTVYSKRILRSINSNLSRERIFHWIRARLHRRELSRYAKTVMGKEAVRSIYCRSHNLPSKRRPATGKEGILKYIIETGCICEEPHERTHAFWRFELNTLMGGAGVSGS